MSTETITCIDCARLVVDHDADVGECVHEVDGRWYRLRCHASTPRHPTQWECLDLPSGATISGTFGTATKAAAWSAKSFATREEALRAFPPAERCRAHRPVDLDPISGLPRRPSTGCCWRGARVRRPPCLRAIPAAADGVCPRRGGRALAFARDGVYHRRCRARCSCSRRRRRGCCRRPRGVALSKLRRARRGGGVALHRAGDAARGDATKRAPLRSVPHGVDAHVRGDGESLRGYAYDGRGESLAEAGEGLGLLTHEKTIMSIHHTIHAAAGIGDIDVAIPAQKTALAEVLA